MVTVSMLLFAVYEVIYGKYAGHDDRDGPEQHFLWIGTSTALSA